MVPAARHVTQNLLALVVFFAVPLAAAGQTLTVTPDGTHSGSVVTNSEDNTAQFTVSYDDPNGFDGEIVSFSCTFAGSSSLCTAPTSIELTDGQSQNVTVYFDGGTSTGLKTLSLSASGSPNNTSDSGSRSFQVDAPVEVEKVSVPSSVVRLSSTNAASFKVRNNVGGRTYTFDCSWTGTAGSCPDPSSAYIAADDSTIVNVTFSAGTSLGSKTLQLSATSGAYTDNDSESVTVDPVGAEVSVNTNPSPIEQYDGPYEAKFNVTHDGSPDDFDMTCTWANGTCSVDPDEPQFIGNEEVDTITVSFSGGATTGSRNLVFAATGSSTADTITLPITVNATSSSQSVALTLLSSEPDTLLNDAAYSVQFEVLYDDASEENDVVLFTCGDTGAIDCTAPGNLPVYTGLADTVTATFAATGGTGQSSLEFIATMDETEHVDTLTIDYTVIEGVSVATVSVPTNIPGNSIDNSATFEISNDGSDTQYTVTCSWPIQGGCSPASRQVTVGGGAADTVSFDFDGGSSATAYSLSVKAKVANDSASVSESVTVDPLPVLVSSVAAPDTIDEGSSDQATFLVDNPGPTGEFVLDCDWAGPSCGVTPINLVLNTDADSVVAVSVSTTGLTVGSYDLTFSATDSTAGGTADTTVVAIHVAAASGPDTLSLTPIAGSGGTVLADDTLTVQLELSYDGEEDNNAHVTCDNSSGIQCLGAGANPYPLEGGTDTLTFSFATVGTPDNNKSLDVIFTGDSTGLADTAHVSLNVIPRLEFEATTAAPSSALQYTDIELEFDLTNNDTTSHTFALECSWATSCVYDDSVTVSGGDTVAVEVLVKAAAVTGSTPLKVTVSGNNASETYSTSVTIDEYTPVNANPVSETVYAEPSTAATMELFELRFTDQDSAEFSVVIDCPGSPGPSCSDSVATYSVGDEFVPVSISVTGGSAGDTSEVTVTATLDSNSEISATASIKVVSTDELLLELESANPSMEHMRSECPQIAAGAGAIVCDDFQYVYPFTPVTRMNRTRQLALIHNSGVVAPQGRVNLDLVLPPGEAVPDTIWARLRVDGNNITDWSGPTTTWQTYPKTTWMGQTYEAGEKYRISFPWEWHGVSGGLQVHDVEVIVKRKYGTSAAVEDTVSGYTTSVDKRYTMGVGWWLGGWEFLSTDTHPTTGDPVLVWHAGDFSTRVYEREISGSDTVFVGWTRARQDTIAASGSAYVRKVDGGGEVHFNAWGFNTMTVSPRNDTTFYGMDVVGCCTRPTSISVSTRGAGRDTIYSLDYHASHGYLEAVRVISESGGWDTFDVVADTFSTSSESYIKSITDPAGFTTTFAQLPDWQSNPGYPLAKVIGPAGDTTDVGYLWDGPVAGVDTVRIHAPARGGAAAIDVTMPYAASGRAGMYWWDAEMTMRPSDEVRSRWDGPVGGAADYNRVLHYWLGCGAGDSGSARPHHMD